MTKSNQYSVFSSGDSISKNRKRECANEAQTLVVWAFSNVIQNWMRNRNTVEFLAVWEELHNPDFNRVQFEAVRNAADVLATLQVMQDFGVNLICVEDGIDSFKDAGKLMISVLSAVAEIERENIRVQTMEGRMQKAREGKWNGKVF